MYFQSDALKTSPAVVLFSNHLNHSVLSALSLVSGSSLFYENPRYIMFICMVINDALQLSLVTALYVVSYIFRKIHTSVCCCLVSRCRRCVRFTSFHA